MLRSRPACLGFVLLLSAAGCSESSLTTERVYPGRGLYAVSDGAHGSTVEFYFCTIMYFLNHIPPKICWWGREESHRLAPSYVADVWESGTRESLRSGREISRR